MRAPKGHTRLISMPPMQLIAGLGNPGAQYARTLHNVGFWLVDALARQGNTAFRREPRFFGEVCEMNFTGQRVRLLKPETFMNLSGQSLLALIQFYRLPVESVLVVHDEIDLPPGTLRLKKGGGHGGHNGLRDIISRLGNNNFARLRVGVGHPGHKDDVHDYVLRAPRKEQEVALKESLDEAIKMIPAIVAGDFQQVMNALHRRKRRSDEEVKFEKKSPGLPDT